MDFFTVSPVRRGKVANWRTYYSINYFHISTLYTNKDFSFILALCDCILKKYNSCRLNTLYNALKSKGSL